MLVLGQEIAGMFPERVLTRLSHTGPSWHSPALYRLTSYIPSVGVHLRSPIKIMSNQMFPFYLGLLEDYSARAQDGPRDMERN